jgi:hypothetical protein
MDPQRGFAAGTQVHTEQGLRAIESVVPGDRVLAGAADGTPATLRTVRDVHTLRGEVVLLAFRGYPGREERGTLVVGRQQLFHVVAIDAGGGLAMPVGEWRTAETLNAHSLVAGRRDPRLRSDRPHCLRVLESGELWVELGDGRSGSELAASPVGAPWSSLQENSRTCADDYPARERAGFEPEPGEEHLLWWETPARMSLHGLDIDGVHGYYVHATGLLVRD